MSASFHRLSSFDPTTGLLPLWFSHTSAEMTPAVTLTAQLPMTKAAFKQQEDKFITAVAQSANVASDLVSVVSVTEVERSGWGQC